MKRKIINIDQDACTGCGDCLPNCPEGAIQVIDGKARLIGDLFCDGLGACLGHCPVGAITIEEREAEPYDEKRVLGYTASSAWTHWPLQLHLISPQAPHYQGSDLLLAADCTAFSLAAFHKDYLKGRTLAIACPKLDEGQDVYVEKIKALIDEARINTLTVLIMQVPCCGGLLHIARTAAQQAARKVPIKCVIVSLQGTILKEEWL
jgi:ferredoxin